MKICRPDRLEHVGGIGDRLAETQQPVMHRARPVDQTARFGDTLQRGPGIDVRIDRTRQFALAALEEGVGQGAVPGNGLENGQTVFGFQQQRRRPLQTIQFCR